MLGDILHNGYGPGGPDGLGGRGGRGRPNRFECMFWTGRTLCSPCAALITADFVRSFSVLNLFPASEVSTVDGRQVHRGLLA